MSVARVEQLFALACSTTSEEEARTAAITGVRLMKKLGLRVGGGSAPAPFPVGDVASAWAAAWYERAQRSQAQAREREARSEPPPAPRPPVEPPEPPPVTAPPHGTWRRLDPSWRAVRRSIRCDGCGEPIRTGDKVYQVPDMGTLLGFRFWCHRH